MAYSNGHMFQLELWVSNTGIEMKRLLVCLISLVLLTSCGGGGGSNSISTFETPTYSATYSTAQLSSLYYETSPSGLTGTLSKGERFNFKAGDVVSFYISETNRFLVAKSPALTVSFADLNTQNADIEKPVLTAYYIDAPVKGLTYKSLPSGLTGHTNESGAFRFFSSDETKLYLDSGRELLISEINPTENEKYFLGQKISEDIDFSVLAIVFSALDIAQANSSYIDVSDLPMTENSKYILRNMLRRTSFSTLNMADIFAQLSDVRGQMLGVGFKNSNQDLMDFDLLRNRIYSSLQNLESILLPEVSASDSVLMDEQGEYYFGTIDSLGNFNYIDYKTGIVFHRKYEVDGDAKMIIQRGYARHSSNCLRMMELKKIISKVEVYAFRDDISAVGCSDNHAGIGAIFKYRINSNDIFNQYSGKSISFNAKAICGDNRLKISLSGTAAAPYLAIDLRPCNVNFYGALPLQVNAFAKGVYVANFDNISPRIRLAFAFVENVIPLIATTFYVQGSDGLYDDAYSAVSSYLIHE